MIQDHMVCASLFVSKKADLHACMFTSVDDRLELGDKLKRELSF